MTIAFAVLAAAILSREAVELSDFDQRFYTTIAYDMDRYGVFSNGTLDDVDSVVSVPPPGMFFGPVYPMLVLLGMKVDDRFARAVSCSIESIHNHRDASTCDPYARPMRILHAFLLALGVVMIALSARLIVPGRFVFWIAGALATVSLALESEIFSYVMTESVTFSVFSVFAYWLLLAWTTCRSRHFAHAGGLLGVLCLTRPSFLILVPVIAVMIVVRSRWLNGSRLRFAATVAAVFALAFCAVAGTWATRNFASVGKFGLTEEYGAATLIERFAYNDMTLREFALAFPYCTPGIGELAFDLVYGTDSMHRFVFHTAGSFFHTGRAHREELIALHKRLDPVIGEIVAREALAHGFQHVLVSIPLAWCGMWAGWLAGLALVPLFAWSCIRAVRDGILMYLLYSVPATCMLGLHALVANHTTRYNLILIGPFVLGAAMLISEWLETARIKKGLQQAHR
ncbi:MAG TPA: hypothetical protein VK148_30170 [Xanthobacteraceae bacterium]|nr:hypothetical protein [Xanthobacteraceae bacterium]